MNISASRSLASPDDPIPSDDDPEPAHTAAMVICVHRLVCLN